MNSLRDHCAVKTVAFILSMVFPCVFVLFLAECVEMGLLNVIWCGFYGVVLTVLCTFPRWFKVVVVILNLVPFVFLEMGFLMGGWDGLCWLLRKAVLPLV